VDGKLVGHYLCILYTPWQGFLTILDRKPLSAPREFPHNPKPRLITRAEIDKAEKRTDRLPGTPIEAGQQFLENRGPSTSTILAWEHGIWLNPQLNGYGRFSDLSHAQGPPEGPGAMV